MPGPQGEQGPDGSLPGLDPDLTTLEKTLSGLGGRDALMSFAQLRIASTGSRLLDGEGHRPDEEASEVSTFSVQIRQDLTQDHLRIDWNRTLGFVGGAPLSYVEIVRGNLGIVDGMDNIIGIDIVEMTSARWAAVRRQHRLLNPHLIIRDVLQDRLSAEPAPPQLHGGRLHEVLRVQDAVAPIDLLVDPVNGQIGKLVTKENHHLKRDVSLEVHYGDWTVVGAISFPMQAALTVGGATLHLEVRTEVEVNPTLDGSIFEFPQGTMPVFDQFLADFGERSHQFHQAFSSIGIPVDLPQVQVVNPTMLAPGVYLLGGISHHSMAIEQENGVVIVEAPLYPEWSEGVLTWAATQFPNKPITHVVATHHHQDHAAGLRTFVGVGAQVVVSAVSAPFFRRLFLTRSSVVPDRLEENFVPANLAIVPVDGSISLPDPINPISVLHIPTIHAADMLVVHASASNHLFNSDLYNPGNGGQALFPPTAAELLMFVDSVIGTQPTLVGGHGWFAPYSELQSFVRP